MILTIIIHDSLIDPDGDLGLLLGGLGGSLAVILAVTGLIRFVAWIQEVWAGLN